MMAPHTQEWDYDTRDLRQGSKNPTNRNRAADENGTKHMGIGLKAQKGDLTLRNETILIERVPRDRNGTQHSNGMKHPIKCMGIGPDPLHWGKMHAMGSETWE